MKGHPPTAPGIATRSRALGVSMRLRPKILLLLFLPLLAVAGGVWAALHRAGEERALRAANEELEHSIEYCVLALEARFHQIDELLLGALSDGDAVPGDAALERLIGRNPAFRQVEVYDAELRRTHTVGGEPRELPARPDLVAWLAWARAWDRDVRLNDRGLARLTRFVPSRDAGAGAYVSLVFDLEQVAGPTLLHAIGAKHGAQGVLRNRLGVNSLAKGEPPRSGEVLVHRARLPSCDGVVELSQDEGDAVLGFRRSASSSLVLFAAMVVALAGVLWLGVRASVLTPVGRILRRIEDFERGASPGQPPSSSGDELGVLERALHSAAENAQRSARELRQLNDELEQRVEERTGELRRYADQLERARAEAEAANRVRNEFLSNISHEIRTPMNGIVGMCNLLLSSGLNPEQRDFAQTIESASGVLLNLLNDVLDMSSLEAGRIQLESRRFCIRDCVESVVELAHPAAAQKGLELAWCVDPAVPPGLIGDESRVSQILLNLTANAIKFTASGEVQIEVLREADPGGRVVLKLLVRDTGIGIPKSKQDLLFKPFSQLDSSATRKHGGSGLGLAISRRLARLMGGDMGVESVEDAGSTFWFTLCLEVEPHSERRRPLEGAWLLAVASAPFQRRALACLVADWGGTCAFAERGPGARSPFEAPARLGRDPGALLVDLKALGELPGDALAAIDADPHLGGLPRVLLFAHNGFDQAHGLARPTLDLCLPKPLRRSTLRAALELARTRAARNQLAAAAAELGARSAACDEHQDGHEDIAMDSCSDEPLLDMAVIAMLKELGGADEPELFEELVELFIEDSRHHLEELAEALRSGDSARLERTAHTLKSSSANIGARSLSRLCGQIEQLGRACRPCEAAALVSMAGREYAKVERALASPGA